MDFDPNHANVSDASQLKTPEAGDSPSETGAGVSANDSRGNKTLLVLVTLIAIVAATVFIMRGTRGTSNPHPKFQAFEVATLDAYKGKVVLVNFWATWCEPCRQEIPALIEFQQKYADRGFTILGVAMDDEGDRAVAPFVEKERFNVGGKSLGMNYPIFIGNEQLSDKFGGLIGYPTTVLISRDGRQVQHITGVRPRDEMAKLIEALL
jgi:thiol-disulfide isomerase/thioredoxin